MGSAAPRGQVAVRGERFDSPRWEGLWGWAECEAGDEAGETEVVPEKLGFSGRFLQLDSRDFGSRRHTVVLGSRKRKMRLIEQSARVVNRPGFDYSG